MKRIELHSEELAEELQAHLPDVMLKGATYDRARKVIQFPDDMDSSEWSNVKDTVEKWAKGRSLDVVESLTLQPPESETMQRKADVRDSEAELKKKLEGLTPQKAEERYDYLKSKSISELTDAEYDERLALAQGLAEKAKTSKKEGRK